VWTGLETKARNTIATLTMLKNSRLGENNSNVLILKKLKLQVIGYRQKQIS
jgi:hypothetical protein